MHQFSPVAPLAPAVNLCAIMNPAGQPARRIVHRLRTARRRVALVTAPESPRGKRVTLVALVVLTGGITLLSTLAGVRVAPALALTVPVVLGGFLLDRPALQA